MRRLTPGRMLPVVSHENGAGVLYRRYGVTLDVRLANDPSQTGADHKDENNQPPRADAQKSSPATRYGFGRHVGQLS